MSPRLWVNLFVIVTSINGSLELYAYCPEKVIKADQRKQFLKKSKASH